MKNLPISEQKGVTLIELLVTIVIFSIIATVAYSFLMNTYQFNEKAGSRTDLVREGNLLVSELRNFHDQGGGTLLYSDDQLFLYEAGTIGRNLLKEGIYIESLSINGDEKELGIDIDELTNEQVKIDITITNGSNDHHIQTRLHRLGDL